MHSKSCTSVGLTLFLIFGLILSFADSIMAVPKYETAPKPTYSENAHWRNSYATEYNKTDNADPDTSSTKDRLQRLGYSTGYGSLNSYPGTGISTYNPIKLDLGGVVLGTLVGIGAIIIIPKLLSAFHSGYGGYGRSENDGNLSGMEGMLNKIDEILGQNNIDSTSCMQRAVCSYVRSTEYNMQKGEPDKIDEFVHILTQNSLVDYLLDGTAIKEALEYGKKVNGKSCEEMYVPCSLDNQTVTDLLKKLLPQKQQNKSNPNNPPQ